MNSDPVNPEFNDSIGYLRTIRWLINTAHISAANDGNYEDWFRVLEQLHIEIFPRLANKEDENVESEIKHLEHLREKCKQNKQDFERIRDYHLWLNAYVHKHGLAMKDSDEIDNTILD